MKSYWDIPVALFNEQIIQSLLIDFYSLSDIYNFYTYSGELKVLLFSPK